MNKLIVGLFCLFMMSCAKEEACTTINYEVEFNAALDQEFCLDDGNSLKITKVDDSLCPCSVTCIYEGYVAFNVEVNIEGKTLSGLMSSDEEFKTSFNDGLILPDNYKIEIRDQLPASATICGGQIKPENFSWNLVFYKK